MISKIIAPVIIILMLVSSLPLITGNTIEEIKNPPHLISNGIKSWITPYGNYSFNKNYFMDLSDINGSKIIKNSIFWLNTTKDLQINKIINSSILIANNTTYKVSYNPSYNKYDIGTITVTYKFSQSNMKITIEFIKNKFWDSQNIGSFNIIWILNPIHNFIKIDNKTIDITSYQQSIKTEIKNKHFILGSFNENYSIINWLDETEITKLYVGKEKYFNENGIIIEFKTNKKLIDPSIVTTVSGTSAIDSYIQERTFHSSGRFWCFYYIPGVGNRYRSSLDGVTWTNAQIFSTISASNTISVWCNDTTLETITGTFGTTLTYRKGFTHSDGTISWYANQSIPIGATVSNGFMNICEDTNGYAWISYRTPTFPYIIKNSNKDGTWSNAIGFPYQLSTTSAATWASIIMPLQNGSVYCSYQCGTTGLKGIAYSPISGFGIEETIAASSTAYKFSMVSNPENGIIGIIYKSGTYSLYFKERTNAGVWQNLTTLLNPGMSNGDMADISINNITNDYHLFWTNVNNDGDLITRKFNRTSGLWENNITLVVDNTILTGFISAFTTRYNNFIGVMYLSYTGGIYYVNFYNITLPSPEIIIIIPDTINYSLILMFMFMIFLTILNIIGYLTIPILSLLITIINILVAIASIVIFEELWLIPFSLILINSILGFYGTLKKG